MRLDMSTSADILREIQAAAGLMGIAPSTLCQRAASNAKLVSRLEAGGTVTVDTVNKIRSYISAHSVKPKRRRAIATDGAAA